MLLDLDSGVEADHVEMDRKQQFRVLCLEEVTKVWINNLPASWFLFCIEQQNHVQEVLLATF